MKTNKLLKTVTKCLLPALALFVSLNLPAQSGLLNLSFENWSTTLFGIAPTGWLGFNLSKQVGGAQQGNNYVRITNAGNSQGVLMLGAPTTAAVFKGGDTYTATPVSLSGFYKSSGYASTDTMGITAYTSKSGVVSAAGVFSLTGNQASWTSFSLPFIVFNPGPNDSIFIVASSGNIFGGNGGAPNGMFDLDNFTLSPSATTGTFTGIDKNSLGTSFMVYPNPASDELNIVSMDESAVSVLITGLDGHIVNELPLAAENTKISLQNYAAGIYFYSILNKDKAALLKSRFVVSR